MDVTKYLKSSYKHLGRSLEEGVDCFGLVRVFYSLELGISLDNLCYLDDWYYSTDLIEDNYKSFGFYESCIEGNYGDVLVLRVQGKSRHLAIVLDETYMLHSTVHGICVSPYTYGFWKDKVVKSLHYRGNVNENNHK